MLAGRRRVRSREHASEFGDASIAVDRMHVAAGHAALGTPWFVDDDVPDSHNESRFDGKNLYLCGLRPSMDGISSSITSGQ